MPTRHLLIKGKVQGVFYRASAKEMADKTGITGWIRNTPDGHVEALVTGDALQLDRFVEWCREGPGRAEVNDVVIRDVGEEVFSSFLVKR